MKPQKNELPGYVLAACGLDTDAPALGIVLHDGRVGTFSLEEGTFRVLSELPLTFELEHLEIYTYGSYCAVVEDRGQHGVVFKMDNPDFTLPLYRRDYMEEHCSFPIAFYTSNDQTYLVHGTDWNRLDITCLDTGMLLTPRTIDRETDTHFLDYFHSRLLMAPDHLRFLSNGWVWSPYDIITIYEVEDFLCGYELTQDHLNMPETSGYLWDRQVAWVDSHTLAVVYNRQEADPEESCPTEILLFDVKSGEMQERIEFDHFQVHEDGEIFDPFFFSPAQEFFLILPRSGGLVIGDRQGKLIHKDTTNLIWKGYSERHQLTYGWHKGELRYCQLPIGSLAQDEG